ncbi:hypothetical protein MOUN0_E00144 [Monosporozyma unispora]
MVITDADFGMTVMIFNYIKDLFKEFQQCIQETREQSKETIEPMASDINQESKGIEDKNTEAPFRDNFSEK